jgi:hypothetical protein
VLDSVNLERLLYKVLDKLAEKLCASSRWSAHMHYENLASRSEEECRLRRY